MLSGEVGCRDAERGCWWTRLAGRHVELGAALRRANRRAEARLPLRRALDLTERGGMRLLARRASDELRAAGARPRRDLLTGLGALTAAEHPVATMAAAGHSNREIAERLYVTQRTVETHLTHAFEKLSIAYRTELAAQMNSGEPGDSPPRADPAPPGGSPQPIGPQRS
jgi:DNA-binding CsgD family transcriptional regulator